MQFSTKNRRQSAALLSLAIGGLLLAHATQPIIGQASTSAQMHTPKVASIHFPPMTTMGDPIMGNPVIGSLCGVTANCKDFAGMLHAPSTYAVNAID